MMQHIDAVLAAALSEIERQAPPKLASTANHAVFPGAARIRPRLCHAVAQAAGSDCPPLLSAVAPSPRRSAPWCDRWPNAWFRPVFARPLRRSKRCVFR